MKKRYALFLFFLLALSGLAAQVPTDSLLRVWNDPELPDSIRLTALHRLVFSYVNSDPDSARLFAKLQIDFAREKDLPVWQGRALNGLALSYRFQSDYEKALQYFTESLTYLEKAGDRNYMAAVYGNMADIYRIQSDLPRAIEYITQSLQIAEETGDLKMAADAYVSIATFYYELPGQESKTLEYLEKADHIYNSLRDETGLILVFGNLSVVYLELENYDKALEYNTKTMNLLEKQGNKHNLASTFHNRATILGYQGKYREAQADFDRAIELFESIGDQEGIADAYNSMGELWLDQGRYALAVDYCTTALGLARTIGSPNFKELYASECLFRSYRQLGDHKTALGYLEQTMMIKDSLQQYETEQRLREMEIQRQIALDSLARAEEKFELEMAIRRKDRTMGWLTAGVLGFLTVALAFWVSMLYFRRRSQRLQARSDQLKKQQLLGEIALLRTQVNPHFLFNSLSILTSLVHVDPNLSEQFIEQLSRSYRYILEQKEEASVTLRTELDFIQSYAFLLKIRFENKFDLLIDLPNEILDTRRIAPLTLQLLIENAVKHNRMSTKEPLVISVALEDEQTLVVKNRLQPRSSSVVSTGMGLKNISNHYALLTDRSVWAGEENGMFVVRVPLL